MKKNKLILVGLMFLFIFSVQFLFRESNSILVKNPSLSQSDNIKIISGSPFITRWDFYNDTTTKDYLYNETFGDDTNYWDLYGVSERYINTSDIVVQDAYVSDEFPDDEFGLTTTLRVYRKLSPEITKYTYLESEVYPYLDDNVSSSSINFYITDLYYGIGNFPVYTYKTSEFDESTINWNNKPAEIGDAYSYDVSGFTEDNWWDLYIGNPHRYYVLTLGLSAYRILTTYSKEQAGYEPHIKHHFSKNYQGNSILYCQTNTTETLTLGSPDNLGLSLNPNHIIYIKFNTTSTNQINFNLKDSGESIKKSYVISIQGNTNFNTKEVYLIVDNEYSIEQLEFTGIFDDEKSLIVDDILIYTEGTIEKTVFLGPDEQEYLSLPYPKDYTIKIFEKGILEEIKTITTSSDLQTLIFSRPRVETVYLTYYDSNYEFLDFNHYNTYANYTLENETFTSKRLSSNIIYVDSNTLIQFNIYDSFNVLIKTWETYEEDFIDITLNVYSLKIKNEMTEISNYTIKNEISDVTKSGNIYPEEIIEFSVAVGDYILKYINKENYQLYTVNISLLNHRTITLNSTYYQVYFSIFNYDGLGLDQSIVRFYINNERKDFGFNTLKHDTVNLKILDFFNATLYDQDVNLRGYTEYNIPVEVYTLIVINNYTHSIIIKIKRTGSSAILKEVIPAQTGIPYRFLPEIEYEISCYYTNETLIEEKDVKLNKDPKLVSFGFYSTELPAEQEPIIVDPTKIVMFIVLFVFFALIFICLFRIYGKKK